MPDDDYDYRDEAWRDDYDRYEAYLDDVRKGDLWRDDRDYGRGYYGEEEGLLARLLRALWRRLRSGLLALLITALVLPSMPFVHASAGSFAFDYTLLGLSTDLNGVYAERDWMLLVGDGGLVAHATRDAKWVYTILGMGGADLRDIVWKGDKGIAIGAGRVVLIERIRDSFTLRDIPFLMDDYTSAVWSLDGSFAILASSSGALYHYRPGEPTATRLESPRAALLLQPLAMGEPPYAVFIGATGKGREERLNAYVVTGDRRVLRLSEVDELGHLNATVTYLLESLPLRDWGKKGPVTALMVLTLGSGMMLAWSDGNILSVNDAGGTHSLALAFPIRKISGYLEEGRARLVAVGVGGGVAIIDPLTSDVTYISVPSATKITFLDKDTALITSPFGLFIYGYGRAEYIPMSSPPSAVATGSPTIVADFSGALYELVRPEPWRGGLSLKHLMEGGHVIDVVETERAPLLVVRKGSGAEAKAGLEGFTRGAERFAEGAATLGDETALYLMTPYGLDRLAMPGLQGRKIVDADVNPESGEVVAVGLEGAGLSLSLGEGGVESSPVELPKADYLSVAWSPWACQALIAGTGGVLIAYDGKATERAPTPPASLRAVAWSPDGAYALVGGDGVLLAWDGVETHEVPLKHVLKFLHIAPRPGGREFLASTSLGLMSIGETSRPEGHVESRVTINNVVRGEDHIYAEGMIAIVPALLNDRIVDYEVKAMGPVEFEEVYVPDRIRSGCPSTSSLSFKILKDEEGREPTSVSVYLTLIGERGRYELSPLRVEIKPQEGGLSLATVGGFTPILAFPLIFAVGAVAFVKLRKRRKLGKESGRLPWSNTREPEARRVVSREGRSRSRRGYESATRGWGRKEVKQVEKTQGHEWSGPQRRWLEREEVEERDEDREGDSTYYEEERSDRGSGDWWD